MKMSQTIIPTIEATIRPKGPDFRLSVTDEVSREVPILAHERGTN
jgi:hypothetical protein